MTKKEALIVTGGVILLVLAAVVTYIGGAKMSNGVYKIEGNKDYPNAKIVVEDGNIQFYDIDLNAIYREKQLEEYNKVIKTQPSLAFSQENFQKFTDLNANFVDNQYKIDYQKEMLGKEGTFTYTFSLYPGKMVFGLGVDYDALRKKIHICNGVQQMTFSK